MARGNSYHLFIFLAVFQSSYTQRRIKDGFDIVTDKPYMVYLLRAADEVNHYYGWTCGGAIVSESFVITSAACVQDVKHIYVVSGYKTYVSADEIHTDQCVTEKKKKVVQICVPLDYHFEYNKTERWAKLDIALIKVESPFDFTDKSYETLCSYTPKPIEYNTERDFPENEVDVIVMGWGHIKEYRQETHSNRDMNQKNLHYAPTKIKNINFCAKQYEGNAKLAQFIAASMLCTLERGNLNDEGNLIERKGPGDDCNDMLKAGLRCNIEKMEEIVHIPPHGEIVPEEILDYPLFDEIQESQVVFNNYTNRVHDDTQYIYDMARRHSNITTQNSNETREYSNSTSPNVNNTRQNGNSTTQNGNSTKQYEYDNSTRQYGNYTRQNSNITKSYSNNTEHGNNTRRHEFFDVLEGEYQKVEDGPPTEEIDMEHTPGICQNDHGGPLIAWRGSKEILVGIATLYKLNEKRQCMGPFLYTKTSCNFKFLDCILKQNETSPADKTRRINCEDPAELGFSIVRRSISWVGHKDGPADNEIIGVRSQVPMSAFQPLYGQEVERRNNT